MSIFKRAPTAIRAIKRVDDQGESTKNFDLSTLKNIFLAGERLQPLLASTGNTVLSNNLPCHI